MIVEQKSFMQDESMTSSVYKDVVRMLECFTDATKFFKADGTDLTVDIKVMVPALRNVCKSRIDSEIESPAAVVNMHLRVQEALQSTNQCRQLNHLNCYSLYTRWS